MMTVSVCLFCLSVREHIGNYTSDLHQFLCMVPMSVAWSSSGSVTNLFTSGFIDDIIFAHNGPYAVVPV